MRRTSGFEHSFSNELLRESLVCPLHLQGVHVLDYKTQDDYPPLLFHRLHLSPLTGRGLRFVSYTSPPLQGLARDWAHHTRRAKRVELSRTEVSLVEAPGGTSQGRCGCAGKMLLGGTWMNT